MINELGRFRTRSENVYFDNNDHASIAVFTDVFCFTHAKNNLIKFAHLQKLANQSMLNKAHLIEITKACIAAFMKSRNSLVV